MEGGVLYRKVPVPQENAWDYYDEPDDWLDDDDKKP